MAISGIITGGILDSTSDIITLGLTPGVTIPPNSPGLEWTATRNFLHWEATANSRLEWTATRTYLHWEAENQ